VKKFKIQITGQVQGIGFRPFVYRLAHRLGLRGWVENTGSGVLISLQDIEQKSLDIFLILLQKEKMPLAEIDQIKIIEIEEYDVGSIGEENFFIRDSSLGSERFVRILPDLTMCSECCRELFDPRNRRYLYPFINCTYCGPRFSIISNLPYDRLNTSMREFKMCRACEKEYKDPRNRRFHAEPISCLDCGPKFKILDQEKQVVVTDDVLIKVTELLKEGQIVALKGVGGFQLLADASNPNAIAKLRSRKQRKAKPFAVMFATISMLKNFCEVSSEEHKSLISVQGPIVLLKKKHQTSGEIVDLVSPSNPYLGAFLPSSPLHFLLMRLFDRPLVVTSGNRNNEPICIENEEALGRLQGIADYFLIHDREVVRPLDDSIIQWVDQQKILLRAGRGYAPIYFKSEKSDGLNHSVVGLGAQFKNTFAFYNGDQIFMSQHFGDLDNEIAQKHFQRELLSTLALFNLNSKALKAAVDYHPGYFSNQVLKDISFKDFEKVQHHEAHLYSALLVTKPKSDFLGVVWDGTGYGIDHTIWGGEFFYGNNNNKINNNVKSNGNGNFKAQRVASLRPFALLGGESAIRNPWKILLSLFFEVGRWQDFQTLVEKESEVEQKAIENLVQVHLQKNFFPKTSSVGRLFDAIACLLVFSGVVEFEGQAAMSLEFEALKYQNSLENDMDSEIEHLKNLNSWQTNKDFYILNWQNVFEKIISAKRKGVSSAQLAFVFHRWLAFNVVELAKTLNVNCIILSGGVFQNRLLLSEVIRIAKSKAVEICIPSRVPVNDAGIAVGQLVAIESNRKSAIEVNSD
jgi:hydrogenase maturation protein HypF